MQGLQVVWFKRDLRVADHRALAEAASRGPVLPLYIFEPALWQQPDLSGRHFAFLRESLEELGHQLAQLGQPLVFRTGDAVAVFQALHTAHGIDALWSHQETWNGWTYKRDTAVVQWCNANNVPWYEPLQFGVIRRLKSRDGWAASWDTMMNAPVVSAPERLPAVQVDPGGRPEASSLGITPDHCPHRQAGGRTRGLSLLASFLDVRGQNYQHGISAPAVAAATCSRLSPHLAFGTLSVREVYQATERRRSSLPPQLPGNWQKSLQSFGSRLRWHCHFMQKLEDEPALEFENLHAAYNGLREDQPDSPLFAAWANGQTGFPMVDACMRALKETGWINFRMRAMLMSFASYHLWLHWRTTGLHLARLFTDYEPGIHYSQCQMQSGTTGINTIRIYNPIKQGLDHDPAAAFIKRWVPELRDVSPAQIHTAGALRGLKLAYPSPVVNEVNVRKHAADKIYGLRSSAGHEAEAQRIIAKHASRKSGRPRRRAGQTTSRRKAAPKPTGNKQQLTLPFD